MKRPTIAASCVMCLALGLIGRAADDKPHALVMSLPVEWSDKVTDAAQLPVEQNAWGRQSMVQGEAGRAKI